MCAWTHTHTKTYCENQVMQKITWTNQQPMWVFTLIIIFNLINISVFCIGIIYLVNYYCCYYCWLKLELWFVIYLFIYVFPIIHSWKGFVGSFCYNVHIRHSVSKRRHHHDCRCFYVYLETSVTNTFSHSVIRLLPYPRPYHGLLIVSEIKDTICCFLILCAFNW